MARGCKVALDDFGSGYTTFHHLKAHTVDVVKIAGSFIRDITTDTENQIFIHNLLALARAIGVSTVAECVETPEDADYLAGIGNDLLQGYPFGPPEVNGHLAPALPMSAVASAEKGAVSAPHLVFAGCEIGGGSGRARCGRWV